MLIHRDDKNQFSWKAQINFLKKKHSRFSCDQLGGDAEISWDFKLSHKMLLPLSYVRCEMLGLDDKNVAYGFGDSFFAKDSIVQSFAEAWERLWLLFLCANNKSGQPRSSNGFAAGRTAEHALRKSQNELMERFLFLRAWHEMMGWQSYKLKGVRSRLLCRYLKNKKWEMDFFVISDPNLGSVLTGLARNSDVGAVFDCCYIEGSFIEAEFKIIRSLMRDIIFAEQPNPDWVFPVRGLPRDHGRFYKIKRNLEAFDFLSKKMANQTFVGKHEITGIKTELVVDVSLFPAVAMSSHPDWPELKWGSQAIAGTNPWPHPLA